MAKQGGLAGPRGAYERYELALGDFKIDAMQSLFAVEALAQTGDGYRWVHRVPPE